MRRIIATATLAAACTLLLTSCPETTGLRDHIVKSTVLQETDNTIYVSATTGNDANLGTRDAPKQTINAGIQVFAEDGLTGTVVVAAGTYEVNFYEGTHVVLHEGISVWGGHDPETWEWEQVSDEEWRPYETIIQDVSSGPNQEDANGDIIRPRAVDGGTGLTNTTHFGGFTVRGGTAQSSVGIYLKGSSPTIRRCSVVGGTGQWSVGIYVEDSSAFIFLSSVSGGAPVLPEGQTWTWACGLHGKDTAVDIYQSDFTGSTSDDAIYAAGIAIDAGDGFSINECTIDSGPATTSTGGVSFAEASSGWMGGSTVTAQPSGDSRGIAIVDGSDVTVQDSTVIAGGQSTTRAVGIYNEESTSNTHHNTITVGGASESARGMEFDTATDVWIGQTELTVTDAPELSGLYANDSTGGASELTIVVGEAAQSEATDWTYGIQLYGSTFNIADSEITVGHGGDGAYAMRTEGAASGSIADSAVSVVSTGAVAGPNEVCGVLVAAGYCEVSRNTVAIDVDYSPHIAAINYQDSPSGWAGGNVVATEGEGSQVVKGILVASGDVSSISGNTITIGSATENAIGIDITTGASPYVGWNTVSAGGTGGNWTVGIRLETNSDAGITVENNRTHGGYGDWTAGIFANNRTGEIRGNLIHGGVADSGTAEPTTIGVFLSSADMRVENNTIYGGGGSHISHAISATGDGTDGYSNPEVFNNILWTAAAGDSIALHALEQITQGVTNNLFYDATGSMIYYDDPDGGKNLIQMETYLPDCTANEDTITDCFVDIDGPGDDINTLTGFDWDDFDWHLASSTPASIYEGGWEIYPDDEIVDLDGTVRTGPAWSIGAYEYDGP